MTRHHSTILSHPWAAAVDGYYHLVFNRCVCVSLLLYFALVCALREPPHCVCVKMMADQEMIKLDVGSVVEGWKIEKKLGEGAFGVVYKCSKNDKFFALKVRFSVLLETFL